MAVFGLGKAFGRLSCHLDLRPVDRYCVDGMVVGISFARTQGVGIVLPSLIILFEVCIRRLL